MSNLISALYAYDRNEITVNELVEATNNAALTSSSIGSDALYLNLSFSYGLRLVLPIEPSFDFTEALFESADSANDLNISIEDEINGDELSANVFSYEGETFLVVFYLDEETSAAIKVFSTEAVAA